MCSTTLRDFRETALLTLKLPTNRVDSFSFTGARLILEFGLPEGAQLDSGETQNALTDKQREHARKLTAEDEALPPGLFRPAEFDALRVLTAQQDAEHDMFGEDAQGRAISDEIDLQLMIAYAAAKYTGADDEAEEDGTIDNPNISEGELEVALLRIHSALHAPAVTRSRTASLAREQRERERAIDPQGRADRLLEEHMADAADVTGVAWEAARAAE